ncbi:hypothetical protein FJ938_25685 [Mesorhizobium sp. B2-4-14]|nr:hypothetical protein FJ938_25685 [Mesorhizobium sp. B2-4-14]
MSKAWRRASPGSLLSSARKSARWEGALGSIHSSTAGAAPHPPAGTFSPYSDGEKEAGRNLGVFSATLAIGEIVDESVLSPSLYGERMPAGR